MIVVPVKRSRIEFNILRGIIRIDITFLLIKSKSVFTMDRIKDRIPNLYKYDENRLPKE